MPDESPSLGLERGVARVVPHDPRWTGLFAAERARIEAVLAERGVTLALEHMGSTAIPGIVAKPIIDVLAARSADVDRASAVAALEAAGYAWRGEQGIPGRDFFRRGEPRSWHLHLYALGSAGWREPRDFRDWLLAHPDDAAAYDALKRELAERHRHDREAYIEGKTAFVRTILARSAASASPPSSSGA